MRNILDLHDVLLYSNLYPMCPKRLKYRANQHDPHIIFDTRLKSSFCCILHFDVTAFNYL